MINIIIINIIIRARIILYQDLVSLFLRGPRVLFSVFFSLMMRVSLDIK